MQQNYKEALDEYQHIHKLRELWAGAIMGWMKVGIPVGGALFGFFSFLGSLPCTFNNPTYTCSWLLPLLGWLIFVVPMIMWRVSAHHIDRQIVEMYPRMLELEKKLGYETLATYFYHNLKCSTGKKFLKEKCGLGTLPHDYRDYKQTKKLGNPYQLLLDVWHKHGHRSVTSRGHIPQDWAVVFVGVVTLVLASLLAYSLNTQASFLLCVLVGAIIVIVIGFVSLLAWGLK